MTQVLGTQALDSTVEVFFTLSDGNGGAVAPSDALETSDLFIVKKSSGAVKATTNGLSIAAAFNSSTSVHRLLIDTSNNTGDAGFWTAGDTYTVILDPDTETVDSQSVESILAIFTLDPDPLEESTGDPLEAFEYFGWLDEDDTIRFDYVTRNSAGMATPDAVTITIYKDGNATEKTTANGVTNTIDFDSETGHHHLAIDTSNDTGDDGFWTAGSEYTVKIKTTTPSAISSGDIINITGFSFDLGTQKTDHVATLGTPLTETTTGRIAANQSTYWDNNDTASTAEVGNLTTLLNRIGAFTGSGVNTILGFFQAVMRKDASTPSDVGGTYNPPTDSLEAQADAGGVPTVVPHLGINLTSTAGTDVNMRIWCTNQNGAYVDLSTYTTATASLTLTPVVSGTALFTESFLITDIRNNGFEKQRSTPGFTDDVQYSITGNVTLDGTVYNFPGDSVVVFG